MRARFAWAVGVLLAAMSFALQASAQHAELESGARKRERATLLAARLPDAIQERDVGPAVPGLLIGLGGVGTALFVAGGADDPLMLAPYAVAAAGGASYFLLPETHRNEALAITLPAVMGSFHWWLGSKTDPGLDRSLYAVASGYYGVALLEGLNAGLTRHPGVTRLRGGYARIASPQGRSAISAAELAAIERDFLDTERPIAHWLTGLPLVLGGSLALVPAFENDVAADDRALAAVFGSVTALQGLARMAIPSAVTEYRSGLTRAQLQVATMPHGGGLVLQGTF